MGSNELREVSWSAQGLRGSARQSHISPVPLYACVYVYIYMYIIYVYMFIYLLICSLIDIYLCMYIPTYADLYMCATARGHGSCIRTVVGALYPPPPGFYVHQ